MIVGYVIAALVVLMLLSVMFLLGLSWWESRQEDGDSYHYRPADLPPHFSLYDDATAIHHIDGDPSNNDLDNIELVPIHEYRTNYGRRMRGDTHGTT